MVAPDKFWCSVDVIHTPGAQPTGKGFESRQVQASHGPSSTCRFHVVCSLADDRSAQCQPRPSDGRELPADRGPRDSGKSQFKRSVKLVVVARLW